MIYKNTFKSKRKVYTRAVNYYNDNDITIKDCALKFQIDRHNLSKWVRRNGGKTNPYGKQSIDSNIFNVIDTEEKAYWLGFMYADGNVAINTNRVSLELALKDEFHLKKFNIFLKKSLSIKKDHFRVRCIFSDNQIYNDLIKLGCIPRKSLTLTFPNYNQVSKKLMNHFIRGYIDGDGSIYLNSTQNNNINISVLGTKEFLEALINEIELPKRTLYKPNGSNSPNTWFFQYSGKNAILLIKYLYGDCNIFLYRKYAKYLRYRQIHNYE